MHTVTGIFGQALSPASLVVTGSRHLINSRDGQRDSDPVVLVESRRRLQVRWVALPSSRLAFAPTCEQQLRQLAAEAEFACAGEG